MTQDRKCNPAGFIKEVMSRCKTDTGYGATMRRADNPNLCSMAWEYLVPFCDLSNSIERLSFSLVGAAIAREKPEQDGTENIGAALRNICKGDKDSMERESKRLRRVIACDNVTELIPVLHPILQYIQSKGGSSLSYETLLKDLLFWREETRIRWTKDFYDKNEESSSKEED